MHHPCTALSAAMHERKLAQAKPAEAAGRLHSPLPRQLVVGVVAAADTEAEELAGRALDLLPLGLHGALQELVAVLQVPVIAPVLMDAPDGQEVVAGEALHERFKLIWQETRARREGLSTTACSCIGPPASEVGLRTQLTRLWSMEGGTARCGPHKWCKGRGTFNGGSLLCWFMRNLHPASWLRPGHPKLLSSDCQLGNGDPHSTYIYTYLESSKPHFYPTLHRKPLSHAFSGMGASKIKLKNKYDEDNVNKF